ncbi:MAG: hypothetical protein ACE5LF_06805 [Alphaproteobacteria bacterium]
MSADERLFVVDALDMAAIVDALRRRGATSLPILNDPFRRRLLDEARRRPYRRARDVVDSGDRIVRQDMDVCDDFARDSLFHLLGRRFGALVEAGLEGVAPYPFATPLDLNDLMLQRYDTGSFGITPHRDRLRYINLVCLFTLGGNARFLICADRSGRDAREIDASPGTVILMRAPGFLGSQERPFHAASDVREPRYSFGLRQTRP